jgi:pimeloyl-ACP methyl ester carboxylesterase
VTERLAAEREVIAFDLPGFGESAPLNGGGPPTPAALAEAVAASLPPGGPHHVAGNSLGGWVALELASTRPAASLTLLSPAGLWRRATPWYDRVSLRLSRWFPRHAGGPLARLVGHRLGRVLVLGQTHGRPGRLTPQYARAVVQDTGTCTGFEATLRATATRRFLASGRIDAPVTVAFGSRDRLLLRRQSRHLDQMPAGTRSESLPGCGHVPMADDPAAVTALIVRTAAGAGAEPITAGTAASA